MLEIFTNIYVENRMTKKLLEVYINLISNPFIGRWYEELSELYSELNKTNESIAITHLIECEFNKNENNSTNNNK